MRRAASRLLPPLQWSAQNVAWTDVNATQTPITCGQINLWTMPPSFLGSGGWITGAQGEGGVGAGAG